MEQDREPRNNNTHLQSTVPREEAKKENQGKNSLSITSVGKTAQPPAENEILFLCPTVQKFNSNGLKYKT